MSDDLKVDMIGASFWLRLCTFKISKKKLKLYSTAVSLKSDEK